MMIKRRQFLIGAGSVAALASVGVAMPPAAVAGTPAEATPFWKDGFARLLVGGKVDAELPVRFGIRLQPGGAAIEIDRDLEFPSLSGSGVAEFELCDAQKQMLYRMHVGAVTAGCDMELSPTSITDGA